MRNYRCELTEIEGPNFPPRIRFHAELSKICTIDHRLLLRSPPSMKEASIVPKRVGSPGAVTTSEPKSPPVTVISAVMKIGTVYLGIDQHAKPSPFVCVTPSVTPKNGDRASECPSREVSERSVQLTAMDSQCHGVLEVQSINDYWRSVEWQAGLPYQGGYVQPSELKPSKICDELFSTSCDKAERSE